MQAEGAHIVDIGGMSSRPGHAPVAAVEEQGRILPVLQSYENGLPVPFSVDTDKQEVAEAALKCGVSMLNDCSGKVDSGLFFLAAEYGVPLSVMHRDGKESAHPDICGEVERFFQDAMEAGIKAGMKEWQFILDPGLGFHKSVDENLALMRSMQRFSQWKRPLLLGYSHKRFVATISGEEPGNAPFGNEVLGIYSVLAGADIVRVHDVAQFRRLAQAAMPLRGKGE